MPYQWNPGWSGPVFVAFFVFSSVFAFVVRRKWKLAEIRQAEVVRLMRLAVAETERAEKEAVSFVYEVENPVSVVAGGGIGVQNCAVCQSPTTRRCSRCKAVRYCSGNCQITHWRQVHKYECHPPLFHDQFKEPIAPDMRESLSDGPEVSSNSLGVEDKGHTASDEFYVDQSVSDIVEPQSEPSILVESKSEIDITAGDAKSLETSSTIPPSSESNVCSEIQSGDRENREKLFVRTSENGGSSISMCSSSSGLVEMPDSSYNDDLTRASSGHHSNTNAHNNLEKCSSSGRSLDLNTVETVGCADSTVSQNSSSNHHSSLDKGLHLRRVDKASGVISGSSAAIGARPDIKETSTVGESCEVPRESNDRPLESSSHACIKDHSASIDHGQCFLGNGSQKIENVLPVSSKSSKFDGFLPNGKVSSKRTVQLVTSSSLLRHSQSGLRNKVYGEHDYKMLFPYNDFIRLYNSDKVEMRPCGLVNCGNSCYANAVLQCLAFTRPLAAFLIEGLHAKTCPKKGWCFTCEFEALLIKAKQGKSPLSPTGIISHIHDIGSNFGQGREEDAHEFLRYSIDVMQSACLKEARGSVVSELAEGTTLIQLIFGGFLRSKIKCLRCRGKSEMRERMMDLTVDIHGDSETLEDALARFTTSEILEGENMYRCDRCKSFERAKKRLTILEAPNVLTIALKRYQSGKYGKLNKMVRFPEFLNLAPYMRGSDDNSPVYGLYAVVVHNGHLNATFSGHYVCYVKNTQGKWFMADDSTVKQVEVHKVLSQGAYMLLYSRCSPRAPSLLRKEMTKKMKLKEREHAHSSTNIPRFSKVDRNHTDAPPNLGPNDVFDGSFHRLRKVDSCSDFSSLFSCSDEGSSWSTESAKDSVTSEELGDCPLGELGESGCTNSPQKPSFGDSVYSSLFSSSSGGDFRGRESAPFLYHYKSLTERSSSRSNTDQANSGEPKSGVLFRRFSGVRGAQTFY